MARGPLARARSSAASQVLFDLLPAPAYIFDAADSRFLRVNEAAIDRYGYSRDEFLNLTLLEIAAADDRQAVRESIAERQHTDRARRRGRHVTRDGDIVHVETASQAVRYAGRRSHLEVVAELADHHRMQEALFDSRARLQALFDNALDGILFVDDDGRFVGINPAASALFGWDFDSSEPRDIWCLAPEGEEKRLRQLWESLHGQRKLSGEYTVKTADGSLRDVEFASVSDVLPGLHLSIIRDVTARNVARRQAEEGLRDMNVSLRQLSARARARREEDRTHLSREMHDQLGQKLARLKIDAAWLTDRLRIRGAVSEDIPAKLRTMTAVINETIDTVLRLANDLRPPILDRLGLIAAIDWQILEFQRQTGVRAEFRCQLKHMPLDLGRSTAVFRILEEALANVESHAHATRVIVSLATPGDTLVLTVADDGRGIDAASVEGAQSLGIIGMRERAQLLDGELTVQPVPDGGTLVSMLVPLRERRQAPRDW